MPHSLLPGIGYRCIDSLSISESPLGDFVNTDAPGRLEPSLRFRYRSAMSRKRKLSLFLLTLLSAVLLPLALPNEIVGGIGRMFGWSPDEGLFWGNAVLGFVCIAPALCAISLSPSFGFASLLGLLFGAVSTSLANYWLMFFQGYSFWTMGGPVFGYTGANALIFAFLRGFTRTFPRHRPLLFAICWTVYEYFKSVNFLGYPWGLVAYPIGDFLPLIQFVDTTGIWGLSFLMVLANALVAEGALVFLSPRDPLHRDLRGPFIRQILFALVLFACALSYGALRLARPIPYETKASLLLVQQNIDPWDMGRASDESLRVNLALTLEGARSRGSPPDLAVWSESSVSNVLVEENGRLIPAKNLLVPGVRQAGIPVLFGGIVVKDMAAQQFMNASILVSPEGKVLDTYGKMHPVPFAESIPFIDNPVVLAFFKKVVGIWNPWVMGERYTVFRVPLGSGGTLSFGTPICFEDAFSSLCRGYITRGADILVNITNDSWSKTWSSEIQHFAVARFRAVENRRVLVRSANGGVTTVVGPWGEIRDRLPFFERMAKRVEFPVYREKNLTPYSRFGDWFPRTLIIVLLVILDVSLLPRKNEWETPRRRGAGSA